jgi:hypothetical protein
MYIPYIKDKNLAFIPWMIQGFCATKGSYFKISALWMIMATILFFLAPKII